MLVKKIIKVTFVTGKLYNFTIVHTFKIEGEFIHLIQLLKALSWVQTGGHAQLVVMEGEVLYNGEVDYRKRLKVRAGDTVSYNGLSVRVIAH